MLKRLCVVALIAAIGCAPAPAPAPAGVSRVEVPALAPDTSWVRRGALYEVFVRDFSPGGDFQGVIDGLDRIQAAGADVVWLMPIFPIGVAKRKGTLGSPYAVRDYYAIEPSMGTSADFRRLVAAVHRRGMKLILDWVPNHTAADAVWVGEHPDFYIRNAQGQPSVPRDPDGKLTDWTDVVQLDYGNPELRRAMIAAMRHWLVEYGVDGFRVDVAGFIPDDFWREALPALRASVPRPILLLAEWGDLRMHRVGFDLTYGWEAYSRLKEVWRGGPASSFVEAELEEARAMPEGGMRLRFTTNHDETAWDEPPITLFGGRAGGGAGARAAFVAMALLPGRPLLYNGQEVESGQRLGLFEREPVQWNTAHATEARAFYRRVLDLARSHPAFLGNDLAAVETDVPDVIAYRRGTATVVVNPRPNPVEVTVMGFNLDGARDLLSGRFQRGQTVALPGFGRVVLE